MAAGLIAAPGSKYGPCKEACKHRDCAAIKADAAKLCRFCGKAIGYDCGFYNDDAPGALVHAACLEGSIERERAATA